MRNDNQPSDNRIREIIEIGFAAAIACAPIASSYEPLDAPVMGFATGGRIVTKKPKARPVPFEEIMSYRPVLKLSFRSDNLPYGEICERYGISVSSRKLQDKSGYPYGNYTAAKNGHRGITAGQMMTACFLSGISLQDTYDAFFHCKDVNDLLSYGYETAILAYLIKDRDENGKEHGYDEFAWYTIKAYELAGIDELPRIFSGNKHWQALQQGIRDGSVTLTSIVFGS